MHAVAAGRVRYAGRFRGYGNVVILDHGADYFSVSAHLDRIDVALGEPVEAGGALGTVGETGSLEGPQLYFELRRGGEALDPSEWLAVLGTASAIGRIGASSSGLRAAPKSPQRASSPQPAAPPADGMESPGP